jgi:putative peptide zinc metalloprotease protein
MSQAQKTGETAAAARQLAIPPFVTITDVTPAGQHDPEFVICNEATGKYFKANRATVQFIDALRRTGSVQTALSDAGIMALHADALIKPLVASGVLTESGKTAQTPAPKPPVEGKLISLRFDVLNAAPVANAFGWLGRALFSPLGYLAWGLGLIAAAYQLIENADKIGYSLRQLPQSGATHLILVLALYVGIKAIHELGHALAYRTYCVRQGLEPGPIRMGLAIFAMTPFPFTDVTGAWRLRSRWQRAMIGAGGMYFETWAIIVLTLIWSQVQTGPFQTIVLQVAVLAGAVTLLFNLNPAVKLDGYYILTDLIARPNLAGRASSAARAWVARLFGARAAPVNRIDLGYWIISYLYRWTIFAGIFWLSYQFDPRLSVAVLVVTVMMLVVRPALATFKYLRTQDINMIRTGVALAGLAGLAVLVTIPLPDRVLMSGQYRSFDTRYVEPRETSRLTLDGTRIALRNPELDQQKQDIVLRRTMLENTARSITASAQERAALQTDIDRLSDMAAKFDERLVLLDVSPDAGAVWTPLAAEQHNGAWVVKASAPLAAISAPTRPYFRLRLDQSRIEQDLQLGVGTTVRVRLRHDPSCQIEAQIETPLQSASVIDDQIILKATSAKAPPLCAQTLNSGSAVMARMDAPPKSILQQIRFRTSRLLQDRLPVNLKN